MSAGGEGLVLHIGVEGSKARQDVNKLVEELKKKLGDVKIDLTGTTSRGGQSKSLKNQIRQQTNEAVSELKRQQQTMTQVIEAGIRARQTAVQREENRARVAASRAQRGDGFDPMLPFMNPMLSGRGLSGRTRNSLQQYKDRIRSEQRERDQILRQQTMDQQRMQREAERAQLAAQRNAERAQQQYIRSQSSLARQRQREDQRIARQTARDNTYLQSMIRNPVAYDERGMRELAEWKQTNVQAPRLARAAQADRSTQLAFQKRGNRGPDQKAIAAMFNRAGVYRANEMRGMNRGGRMGGMMGMGAYQIQQMFEDYQYAGVRGLGNNMAFMGASIGGPAGMGIIGGALALQIGELTYKMLGYADAQEKAAKASELLTKRQLEFIDISHDVSSRFASGESSTSRQYAEQFENPQRKLARQKLTNAFSEANSSGNSSGVLYRLTNSVMKDPAKFLDYAAGLGVNVPGMRQSRKDAQTSLGDAQSAQGLIDAVREAERLASMDMTGLGPEGAVLAEQLGEKARKARESALGGLAMHPQFKSTLGTLGSDRFWSGTTEFQNVSEGIQRIIDEMGGTIAASDKRLSDVQQQLRSPRGARQAAMEVLNRAGSGDLAAFDLAKPFMEGSGGVRDAMDAAERLESIQERMLRNDETRERMAKNISIAERETASAMGSQLSYAENMADSFGRKAAGFRSAGVDSRDSFAGRMFGINRERTAEFLQQRGAAPGYIQYQDDLLVQGRLKQLRGQASAAGAAGDFERQIKMLEELQQLQMSMAGSDSRYGVAGGFYNAAFDTQKEIEAVYQRQANAAQNQQQAWQGIVSTLQQAQSIVIDPMSPDALPKLQQYLAGLQSAYALMTAMNGANAGQFQNQMQQALASVQNASGASDWYDMTGQGGDYTAPPKARGGLIGGEGRNDTVNARLMPHEFVIRADVVKRLGASTFDQINRTGKLPRMAGGGFYSGFTARSMWYELQREQVRRELARRRGAMGGIRFQGTLHKDYDEAMSTYALHASREEQKQKAGWKADAMWDLFGANAHIDAAKQKAVKDRNAAMYDLFGSGRQTGGGGRRRRSSLPSFPMMGFGSGWGGGGVSRGGMGMGLGTQMMWAGPGVVFGAPISAPAPLVPGTTYNSSSGFAQRLMYGNYSGDQFNHTSYWATPTWYKFRKNGARMAAGGVRETDKGWAYRGFRGGRRMLGGFHAFASGGMVQPFATPSYQPPFQVVAEQLASASSTQSRQSPSTQSTTNHNRSNIGAINISVMGSGAVGQTLEEARRAQHASKLRRG